MVACSILKDFSNLEIYSIDSTSGAPFIGFFRACNELSRGDKKENLLKEKSEKESLPAAAVLEQKGNGINICGMLEDFGFMP